MATIKQPGNIVHETSTSTGSGNLTTSRVGGQAKFSEAFGTGSANTFRYAIWNRAATSAEWEIGEGYMSDATTLVRSTVLYSSNSDALVTFTTGTKDISNDIEALHQWIALLGGFVSSHALCGGI